MAHKSYLINFEKEILIMKTIPQIDNNSIHRTKGCDYTNDNDTPEPLDDKTNNFNYFQKKFCAYTFFEMYSINK